MPRLPERPHNGLIEGSTSAMKIEDLSDTSGLTIVERGSGTEISAHMTPPGKVMRALRNRAS
ncbi:hypothetical protein [Castellaniella sp.]|uniref:hypothetical protein n=1 Tax=Castellaniella sp. TaxID=1955812 RepID=UPI003C714722